MTFHPDFEKHPEHQWKPRLAGLVQVLSERARNTADGAWVVVPSGAFIRVRYLENGRRELRIARTEARKTPLGPLTWEAEVDTYVSHLGVMSWPRSADTKVKGVCCVLTEPPATPCSNCGEPLDDIAKQALQEVCSSCALKAKRAEYSHLVNCGCRGCSACGDSCAQQVIYEPVFGSQGQRCMKCALTLGRMEVEENNRRRAAAQVRA